MLNNTIKLPEVVVFAGPNGSGKTTITRMAKIVGEYINADDIKRTTLCSDLEAAIKAEELREKMIAERKNFTFETVLSTERNLLLLKKAKENGYKKRKAVCYRWCNQYWSNEDIERLTGITSF